MRSVAAVIAGFVLISLAWFWPELFAGRLFCFSDLTFYFYPYRHFMAEAVKLGQIPLWNPLLLMGFPFLATLQPGVFYPLSLFYYLLPFDLASNWFLVVHFPLAAVMMYLFCREERMSTPAAVGAGLTFGFSGYLFSVLHMPTTLAAVTWLPLALLLVKRLTTGPHDRRTSNLVWLSGCLAVVFLGGEPTIFYGTFWVLLVYLVSLKPRPLVIGLGSLAGSFVLALLIDAVQILPFIELVHHCSRIGGIAFTEASNFSLRPVELIETFFPYFFHLTEMPWVAIGWMKSPYLGFVPVVLAGLTLLRLRTARWLWLAIGLVCLIVIGAHGPLYYWLFKLVPGFNLFRYPVKFIFIAVIILAYLAGRGIDLLSDELVRNRKLLVAMAMMTAFLAALFAWLSFNRQAGVSLALVIFADEIKKGYVGHILNATLPRDIANLGIIALFLAVLTAWLAAAHFRKISRPTFAWGLVGLILVDLYSANYGVNFSLPVEVYRRSVPENVKLLQADKAVFRYLTAPQLRERAQIEFNYEYYDYGRALRSLRGRLAPNQMMLYGLADVDAYESIRGEDQEKILWGIWALDDLAGRRVLDMLNIKYLLVPWPFGQPGYELVCRSRELSKKGEIFLYRNRNVLPREYWVSEAKVIPAREAVYQYIFSRQFNPAREVVLEEKVAAPGGYWFKSEWFYPGWKAFVDGKETKICRANYMFRAVPLPARWHKVEFKYEPLSFRLGGLITLATLFSLGLAALLLRRRAGQDNRK